MSRVPYRLRYAARPSKGGVTTFTKGLLPLWTVYPTKTGSTLKRKNLLLVKQMPSVLKVIKRSRNETGRESLLFLSLFSNGSK